ncbi:hypothetical protein [Thiomonas sp.]
MEQDCTKDLREALRALKDQGLMFSDVIAVYGQTPEEDPYLMAAKLASKDGDLELDDQSIVSRGDDRGAYVLMWKWIDDEQVLARGYRNSGYRISDLLDRLTSPMETDQPTIEQRAQEKRLSIYVAWLEDTLSNFSDEIDWLALQPETPSEPPVPLQWDAGDESIRFLPSEAIAALQDRYERDEQPFTGLSSWAQSALLREWLKAEGPKLDASLTAFGTRER